MTKSIHTMTPDATLSQIILADQQAGDLLKAISLDPAGQEEKTLQSVCRQQKWSEVEVLKWLQENYHSRNEQAKENSSTPGPGENISLCCRYNEEKMEYIENLLGKINEVFPRVHQIHGNQYLWLKNMQWPLEQFTKVLAMYAIFEKEEFYPLAEKLGNRRKHIGDQAMNSFKEVPVTLQHNQNKLLAFMEEIREKGNDFKSPAGACSTLCIVNQNFRMLFEKMEELLEIDREMILPVVTQSII